MSETTVSTPDRPAAGGKPPTAVAWALGLVLGTLMLGALYLMLVRGDAIFEDLSALSGYILCY